MLNNPCNELCLRSCAGILYFVFVCNSLSSSPSSFIFFWRNGLDFFSLKYFTYIKLNSRFQGHDDWRVFEWTKKTAKCNYLAACVCVCVLPKFGFVRFALAEIQTLNFVLNLNLEADRAVCVFSSSFSLSSLSINKNMQRVWQLNI